jgi:long-subunit acyl-CoA synthetase (AMP-forming)
MAIEHYNWNQERLLSYLPLSHVAACLIDCYMSMYAATEIHFADQEALKGTLVCIF